MATQQEIKAELVKEGHGLRAVLRSDEVFVGLSRSTNGPAKQPDLSAVLPEPPDAKVNSTGEKKDSIKEPFLVKDQTVTAATARALEGAVGEVWTSLRNMVSFTHGWNHAGHQVTSYDFDALQEWAALPLILCSISVFRLKRALAVQLILQMILILVLIFFIKIPGSSEEELSKVREDASPLLEIALNLGRLVPFLLGLFVSLCLKRWWTMRSSFVQRILSASSELSFWLRVTLPESASWVRERVERDCLLGHKLVYLVTQGKQADLEPRSLCNTGLITPAECERIYANTKPYHLGEHDPTAPEHATAVPETFFDFNLAALPFAWAAHLVYRVFQFGVRTKGERGISIPAPIVLKMLMFCMDARKAIEGIEMMLTQPLPFPYVHLVCVLVHFSALFSCVRAGIVMGTSPTLTASQVVFESFAVLVVNSLYCGLLSLCAVLADPFGNDSIDFPGALLHHKLWKSQLFASKLLESDAEVDEELDERMKQRIITHSQSEHHHEEEESDSEESQGQNADEDDDAD